MSLGALAALAFAGANWPAYRRYRAALDDPQAAQDELLRGYLRANAETAFGRAHGFDAIHSASEYQERVPLARWVDVAPWVERIARGEQEVLTRAAVRVLEPTGGSTLAKRIPYTDTLQRELRRAIGPWIVDLAREDPRVAWGRSYWAITPALQAQSGEPRTAAPAVRQGFDEDAEYLGGRWRALVERALIVPSALRFVPDVESFRYLTLLFLLRASDLVLVSIWHPSFLTLLLDALPGYWERLLADLTQGTLSPPLRLPLHLHDALAHRAGSARRRARELARIGPTDVTRIWPRLRLVSCWGDGHAALQLSALRRALPGVSVQPKGLLATEACVSIPFAGRTPLAVRSHFFEFLEGDRALRAHELQDGAEYSVVVTTGGGLYRYCLEDRVRVEGFVRRTPSVRFLGKEGHVSDLVGEKLREDFVAQALARVFEAARLEPRFALLAPRDAHASAGYALFLDCDGCDAAALAGGVEQALREHGDYRYAAALGQLAPVTVVRVGRGGLEAYLRRCRESGQRLGAVKPLALSSRPGWFEAFADLPRL